MPHPQGWVPACAGSGASAANHQDMRSSVCPYGFTITLTACSFSVSA